MVPMPASIPKPLVTGHQQAEADIGETCEFEAGEATRAPVYRSVPNLVPARWLLTQTEFDAWHDWFEDDLLAGSLTFPLPVADQGGARGDILETEAMFLAPPVERMLDGGDFWELSAQCVTGVAFDDGIVDENCINETFSTGLSAYTTESGTDDAFSNFSAGSYGQALRMSAAAGPSSSAIKRAFAARDVFSIRFKFRLEALNSDDAGILKLFSGTDSIFVFTPRRELILSGGTGCAVAAVGISATLVNVSPSGALSVDTWYQAELTLDATADFVITRLSDSAVIDTTSFGDLSAGMAGVSSLRFEIDEGGSAMSTSSYADIHICGAEAATAVVFLDEFTGSGAATGHDPDIAPTGFAYADAGTGPNTTLELGSGRLIGVEIGYGTAGVIDSSASSPAPDLAVTIPYTIEATLRPSATLADSVVSVEFYDSADALNTRAYIAINRDGSGNYELEVAVENYSAGGGDGWAFLNLPLASGAERAVSLYVSGSTFAVSVDGGATVPPDSEGSENLATAFNAVRMLVDTDSPFSSDNSYVDRVELRNGA